MKHTKGNWHTQDIPAHKRIGIYSDNDDFIGTVFYAENYNKTFEQAKEEANANAKIMAVAPNLLTALQDLYNSIDLAKVNVRKDFTLMVAHAAAKKVIMKAKGE